MARLILVRHGQTDWNRQMRYQGQSDIEMNETGIWQVTQAAERLASEKIDFIYSSDLKRARQTAKIIASKHNMVESIQESPLLREMNFGDFEGMHFSQMDRKYRLIFSADPSWRSSGPNVRVPNGESIADLGTRIDEFIKTVEQHELEETVLIVAHGGPLQVLICQLLGIGLERWWQIRLSGASVSILETYPQGASITLINGVSHLK